MTSLSDIISIRITLLGEMYKYSNVYLVLWQAIHLNVYYIIYTTSEIRELLSNDKDIISLHAEISLFVELTYHTTDTLKAGEVP